MINNDRNPVIAGLLVLILACYISPAFSDTPQTVPSASLTLHPSYQAIAMRGWLSEEETFESSFRVNSTAAQGTIIKVLFEPEDLIHENQTDKVMASQVTITPDKLSSGVPSGFRLKVASIKIAGKYTGKLRMLAENEPAQNALELPLTVEARVRPNLTAIAPFHEIKGPLQEKYELYFRAPAAGKITSIKVLVKGEKNQQAITDKLEPSNLQTPVSINPPGQTIPFKVSKHLAADKYAGNILLNLEGREEPISIPVELTVKDGPGYAIAILILSVIVGRLFKYWNDSGKVKDGYLRRLNRLQARVKNATADDQSILRSMLDRVYDLILQDRLDSLTGELDGIENRLVWLMQLTNVETTLAGKKADAQYTQVFARIAQARQEIRLKRDAEAKASVDAVEASLIQLGGQALGAESASAVQSLQDVSKGIDGFLTPKPKGKLEEFRDWMAWITAFSDEARTQALPFLRVFFWLITIAGLVALGMESLYTKNVIFGASRFSDYLGLVFWGLSSETAARTLSNLRSPG